MDVRVGPLRKLSVEELMFLNCGVGGDSFFVLNFNFIFFNFILFLNFT